MIDFHTHILPNMDDGSKDVDESLKLLELLEKQDVKLVCLTSHFYPSHESIDEYLSRRNKAYEKLNYQGPIEIRLGSEVRYYRGISLSDNIESLCIENTNLLLLELPFNNDINDSIINEIIKLSYRNIRIILAHIERYDISLKKLEYLKNNGILIQCNNEFIIGSLFNHKGIKMLKEGYIDVLGSDSHDLKTRKPNMDKVKEVIVNKLGNQFLDNFINNTYKIIE